MRERNGDHRNSPTYADGQLDPHEWIATPDARLLKMNGAGDDVDHTLSGRQPVSWDAAGALTE